MREERLIRFKNSQNRSKEIWKSVIVIGGIERQEMGNLFLEWGDRR